MAQLSTDTLHRVATEILVAGNADPADAGCVADVLTWADRRQNFAQGSIWLDVLSQRLVSGDIVSPVDISISYPKPAVAVVDGRGGFGHVSTARAVDTAADLAKGHGIAICGVRGSSHFGPCGFHALRLAEMGLIGLVATNSYPKVAAHGSRAAVLGTNPLGFAAPGDHGSPIVGDLSTGALAGSRVREAIDRGEPLETGAALDAAGEPTVDPTAIDEGGVMLPVGGAKGFALGLLVEILTSGLSRGAPPDELGSMFSPGPTNTSHVVLAIDAGSAIGDRIDRLRSYVESAPKREGFVVRLPGDRGDIAGRRAAVDLPASSLAALERAGRRVGVDVDRALTG